MLLNIKSRVKSFVNQEVKEIKKHQNQSQQTALDYAQISRLFPESNFIPFTNWSISPSVILHILNDISINKRRNIIEFGSGASTLYIAKLIQSLKLEAKFYSVESSEEWYNKMKGDLELYNLKEVVTLIHAPLKEVSEKLCLQEQKLWYDTDILNNGLENNSATSEDIDLVIVDGPFGGSTPFARYSAIPYLQDRLSQNLGVFLDDSRREEEAEIVKQWSKLLDLTPQSFERYTYFTNNNSFSTIPYRVSNL